ncbi:MAG: MarR family transcriptional regulator [archaeon]|nr:MAG: MarR family transcriptional regulator [archaeon]
MDAEKEIYSLFSNVASSLGYSEVHGRIIAALLVSRGPLSLDELRARIGYSAASVSLSLDFLEMLGVIRRVKKPSDKKLYVEVQGDLLDCLRKAVLFKAQKSVETTLQEFDKYKENGQEVETIRILEKEIKRLQRYISLLSKVKLP